MHVDRTVARAREAIAKPEETPRRLADQLGKGLDLGHRNIADLRCPFRRPGFQMRLELRRDISVLRQILAVGMAVAEQHMHDGAGECTIRARTNEQLDVRLLHGAGVVDIDARDLGAAILTRLHRMGHDIDLGVHRVAAPDDDEIRFLHLARIDARNGTRTRQKARPR